MNALRSRWMWIAGGCTAGLILMILAGYLLVNTLYVRVANSSQRAREESRREIQEKINQGLPYGFSPPPRDTSPRVGQENPLDSGKTILPTGGSQNERLSMADLVELIEPTIVRISVKSDLGDSVGSGFFIDDEGKIVTNYHVVEGANQVTVETSNGDKSDALGYLVAIDQLDLAIIQVDPDDFDITPIAIAKERPRKGEQVAAFGAPQGFGFTATEGIVSAIRDGSDVQRTFQQMFETNVYGRLGYSIETVWIQTTAAISGGNSGGPLVNMKGELVGINTWTHPGGQNLNFASTAEQIADIFADRDGKIYLFEDGGPPVKVSPPF